jgi:hypothetical protein
MYYDLSLQFQFSNTKLVCGVVGGWDSQVCALRTVKNVLIRIMKSARIRTKSDKTIEINPMDKWNYII